MCVLVLVATNVTLLLFMLNHECNPACDVEAFADDVLTFD
jgi:hypothetical protein